MTVRQYPLIYHRYLPSQQNEFAQFPYRQLPQPFFFFSSRCFSNVKHLLDLTGIIDQGSFLNCVANTLVLFFNTSQASTKTTYFAFPHVNPRQHSKLLRPRLSSIVLSYTWPTSLEKSSVLSSGSRILFHRRNLIACSWCVAAPIPALEHLNMSYARASTSRRLTLPSSLYSYDLLQMFRLSILMFALLYLEITAPTRNHILSGCINNRLF